MHLARSWSETLDPAARRLADLFEQLSSGAQPDTLAN
jgi:hypothetical protein